MKQKFEKLIIIAFMAVFVMMLSSAVQAGWIIETVDKTNDTGNKPSLVVDSMGVPHISYYNGSGSALRYVTKTGIEWIKTTIDSSGGADTVSCLKLNPVTSMPHIVYRDHATYNPMHAYYDGSWHKETIDDTGYLGGEDIALAFDASGQPHVVFCYWGSAVYYATKTGSTWDVSIIKDEMIGDNANCDIQVDSTGKIHVVYWEDYVDGGTIFYATSTGGAWTVESAFTDIGEDVPNVSMDLDSSNHPHIVYYSQANGSVRYGVRNGTWTGETFDTALSWNADPHIVMDAADLPHISYYYNDGSDGLLKYATKTTDGWHKEVVDNASYDVGSENWIDLNPAGNPCMAYYDYAEEDLKYAQYDPSACNTTGVEIIMPSAMYHAGDSCSCTVKMCNADGETLDEYPLVVLLDVFGSYFFAPSFSSDLDSYLEEYPKISVGETTVEVLPEFKWPIGISPLNGINWYAAILNPQWTDLHGEMDFFNFGWE